MSDIKSPYPHCRYNFKMKAAKPPIESLAYTVYEKFGAKLEDVLAKSGDKNGQA